MSGAVNYIPVAVPGGGVITITGNDGIAASADGGGNLNITGGAGINVDRIGANALQITSAAVAAKFRADNGIDAEPNAENRVFILGDGNVVTEADALAHTITFSLADDIAITNNIQAGGKVTCTEIECLGPIVAEDCTINDTLTVTPGAGHGIRTPYLTINQDGDPLYFALNVKGIISIYDSAITSRGVVQLTGDPGGFLTLTSDKGDDGQILIGDTDGEPTWSNITSNDGSLLITNGDSSIDMSVNGAPRLQFALDVGDPISPAPTQIHILGAANQIVTRRTGASSMSIGFVGNPQFDAITVTGAANVGSLSSTGNISTDNNVVAGGDVEAAGFVIHGAGPFYGACLYNGVRLEPAVPTLQGQVLIGRPGAVPVWSRLTAGAGIAIDTTTPDNLTLSVTVGPGGAFWEFAAYAPANRLRVLGASAETYNFDNMAESYDPYNVYDPVTGYFTAAATEKYFFTVRIGIARCNAFGAPWDVSTAGFANVDIGLVVTTGGIATRYGTTRFVTAPYTSTGVGPYKGTAEFTWELSLTIGDQVRPSLIIPGFWNYDGRFLIAAASRWGIVKDITTFSGYSIG